MRLTNNHNLLEIAATVITNTAVVETGEQGKVTAEASFIINPPTADLSLVKSIEQASAYVGENLTFVLSIYNNGPCTASNITLKDQLPENMKLVSVDASGKDYSISDNLISFSIGKLNKNDAFTVYITVKPQKKGIIENKSSVKAVEFDPSPDNNYSKLLLEVKDRRSRGIELF